MKTEFIQLNQQWNAHPNAPVPTVAVVGSELTLSFAMNAFQFPQYKKGDIGHIRFRHCWRYRLGCTNDEGWYRGQCRFSKIAPAWGEFYEVRGDLRLTEGPDDWITMSPAHSDSTHFLFYFRDDTFECDADDWLLTVTAS